MSHPARSLAALLVALATTPVARATTYVVDASGGGNFTTIQAAVLAAAAGDVLIVLPGAYGAFVLDRDLAIVGATGGQRPKVNGKSVVQTANARVAGLELLALAVTASSGTVVLDDLDVTGQQGGLAGCDAALVIDGCAQVHVARCEVRGKDGDVTCEGRAVRVSNATATFTKCQLTGGKGWGDSFTGYDGQAALAVTGPSEVLLAATSCTGGQGGTPQILFGGTGGNGAEALQIGKSEPASLARCVVRGSSADLIAGGLAGGGIGAQNAFAVALGNGTLVISGVAYSPPAFGLGMPVSQPVPPEPYLALVGADEPHSTKRLSIAGPAGATELVFASLGIGTTAIGGLDGAFFVSLGAPLVIAAVPTTGQEFAVNVLFDLPPSLAGLEGTLFTFQGLAPGLGGGGTALASNPAVLLLRQ